MTFIIILTALSPAPFVNSKKTTIKNVSQKIYSMYYVILTQQKDVATHLFQFYFGLRFTIRLCSSGVMFDV